MQFRCTLCGAKLGNEDHFENATAMIWKLMMIAQKTWRALKGSALLRDVYDGKRFIDGEISKKVQAKAVAA